MSGTRRGHTGMIGLSWNEESGLPRSRKRTLPWLGPLGPERVRCDSLVYPLSPVNRGGLAPSRQVREHGSSAAHSGLRDPTRIRVSAGTAHQPFPHMTPSDGSSALVQGRSRTAGIPMLALLFGFLAWGLPCRAAAQIPEDQLSARVRELESGDFVRREAALAALSAAGQAGARAALADFESAPA